MHYEKSLWRDISNNPLLTPLDFSLDVSNCCGFRSISHIPQGIRQLSHNATLWNRNVHTGLFPQADLSAIMFLVIHNHRRPLGISNHEWFSGIHFYQTNISHASRKKRLKCDNNIWGSVFLLDYGKMAILIMLRRRKINNMRFFC